MSDYRTAHRMSRTQRAQAQRVYRRRRRVGGVVVLTLVVVLIAAVFVGSRLFHSGTVSDFTGNGDSDVVIEVYEGDSTTQIGQTLQERGVVATVTAFVQASQDNASIAAIQPGFYQLRTRIPAASAVQRLVDPAHRVGRVVIPEGRQLDDVIDVKTNAVTAGVFSLISQASCVELNGDARCVPVAQLRAAAGQAGLDMLNVPLWALERVSVMGADHRRVEGLIAPGTWNVNPAGSPQQILAALISASSAAYVDAGLLDTASMMTMSPYDMLVVASLVQRESTPADFSKVARVIYNRLNENRSLEFDSTVNYPLDRQEVATTDADRMQPTPWNTYVNQGLPLTPICSPGNQALVAAEEPEPGDWLYFVTVDLQGTTLFSRDYQQHLDNIEVAKSNGVLDSAR